MEQLSTVLLRHCAGAVAVTDEQGHVTAWSPGAAAAAQGHGDRPRLADVLPAPLRAALLSSWGALAVGQPVPPAVVADPAAGVRWRIELEELRSSTGFAGVVASWERLPDDALPVQSTDSSSLLDQLRRGIDGGELRLHYQPIVELVGARPVASEALVRWQHPHRGLVGPADFIDAAERSGLVVPLGDWVLKEACRTAAAWGAAEGDRPVRVTVNLSARQLSDASLVRSLTTALAETGCPADRLVFEVTETAVMADLSTAVRTLTALKDLGVGLAIDDFGTGYSSLLYLKHFPVDSIKIDRSFVAGLGRDADDSAIVAATISLAHSVDVQCVAEGVETVEHLDLLRSMECDYAQGFLFSRPLELPDLRRWFDDHLAPAAQEPAPVPHGSDTVGVVHEMLAAGASLHTIAAALNARGSRTAKGTRWSSRSVAHLVAREQFPHVQLPAAR